MNTDIVEKIGTEKIDRKPIDMVINKNTGQITHIADKGEYDNIKKMPRGWMVVEGFEIITRVCHANSSGDKIWIRSGNNTLEAEGYTCEIRPDGCTYLVQGHQENGLVQEAPAGRPAGRPSIYAKPMKQTAVWLTTEMLEWLKSQPGSMSDQLRAMIEEKMQNERK